MPSLRCKHNSRAGTHFSAVLLTAAVVADVSAATIRIRPRLGENTPANTEASRFGQCSKINSGFSTTSEAAPRRAGTDTQ